MMSVDYVGISLVELRDDGFVWFQPQPYGDKGTGESYEAATPFGLMGRPRGKSGDIAPNCLVFRMGPEGFIQATTDPRYQDLLPDLGEGGAGIYGCVEQSGSKIPYVGVYGAGGGLPEGTVEIRCKAVAGDTTFTIDPTSGDVTITHPGGAVVVVKAASVELGAATGGLPLALAAPIIAWAATVETRLGTLGQSGSAPVGVATTKVNGI